MVSKTRVLPMLFGVSTRCAINSLTKKLRSFPALKSCAVPMSCIICHIFQEIDKKVCEREREEELYQ